MTNARTTAETSIVDRTFRKGLKSLKSSWTKVEIASENLSEAILNFAQEYVRLENEAKELDGKVGEANKMALKQEFAQIFDKSSESILSKWRTIGRLADRLLPYAMHLPTNYESLYLVSKSVENKTFDIQKNIEKGFLAPATTVRNVRAITQQGQNNKKPPKRNKWSERSNTEVILVFKGNEEIIADWFSKIDSLENLREIHTTKGLVDKLKTKIPERIRIKLKVR